MSKKKDDKTVHSSVVENMAYVAEDGDNADSIEMCCEDGKIWPAHNIMAVCDIIVGKFSGNKKEHIDLLLLADESEDMIDKYLERGEMFILENDGVKGECVVTKEADGVYEIKNIAVLPECQRNGYGKSMIDFVFFYYTDCQTMLVGTGDVPSALSFYQKCGFTESHRINNFFTENYDHPMFEDGKQLVDMVYLKRVRKP